MKRGAVDVPGKPCFSPCSPFSHVLAALGLLSACDPLPVLALLSPCHPGGTSEIWTGIPWEMHLFLFSFSAPNKENLGMGSGH